MADSTTDYDIGHVGVGAGLPDRLDLAAAGDMTRTTEVLGVETDGSYTAGRHSRRSISRPRRPAATDPEELGLDGAATTDFAPLVDVPLIVEHGRPGTCSSADAGAGDDVDAGAG